METIKRLIIYTYSGDANVPEYVLYSIKELMNITSNIVIISGRDLSGKFDNNIKIIENSQLSSIDYEDYEEIIFTNDSCYGPFFSFDKVFSHMSEYDFWSLDNSKCWMVFKREVFKLKDFLSIFNKNDFIKILERKGFKYGKYLDNQLEIDSNIIHKKCPLLPKRNFIENLTFYNYRIKYAFDYIKTETPYDTNLILKDLISENKSSLLNDNLHFNYILPSNYSTTKIASRKKTALIVYIFEQDLIEYFSKYINLMPENADIYIITTSNSVEEKCRLAFCNHKNRIEYRIQENRGRDNTALLVTCKDVIERYDYICFVHSKTSSHMNTNIVGDDFRNHCVESLLASKNYVEKILSTFEENELLGLLIPFPPTISPYHVIGNEWMDNYKNAQKFIKNRLNLNIELETNNPIGAFGGMFWFKSKAFSTLLSANLSFEDFPQEPLASSDGLLTHAIERLIPTLAENDGFYTAYVAPEYYASIYLNNLIVDVRNLKKELKKYNSLKYLFKSIIKKLFNC